RRWSARRSEPCSTRSRTVRLPWSSKAPRPPPAQTRLPRPFCDALEAGLRAGFHETEWKICYGLDSLVEGFIRRRDVPPADAPPCRSTLLRSARCPTNSWRWPRRFARLPGGRLDRENRGRFAAA